MKLSSSFTFITFKALYSFQSPKTFMLFRILDPLIHYSFFAILALSIVGTKYLSFILIGNVAFYTASAVLFNSIFMFRWERHYKTLELNMAAPMATFKIILKKSLISMLDGLLIFFISTILISLIFSISFPLRSLPYLILIVLVMLFSLGCLSLLLAGLSLLFVNANLFLNIFLSLFQVLCGVNFSVSLLPKFLTKISNLLPLTHAIGLIRDLQKGIYINVWSYSVKEFIIGIFYFVLSLVFIGILENSAKKKGTLLKDS